MIDSIRHDIEGLHIGEARSNLSLLFNRLCPKIDGQREHTQKERTLMALTGGYTALGYLDLYKHALEQWRQTLESDPDMVFFEMEVTSPLVVGKGDQNVHEFGITLQLPWGTPVIPGSAVKGVLSSFAHERGGEDWHKGALAAKDNTLCAFSGKLSLIMFGGTVTSKDVFTGCLDFFDAWWVPSGKRSPFAEDIINVHNKSYYQTGTSWPDGMDSPVPNKFAVIQPGEKFLFAIKGTKSWRGLAREMLAQAAEMYGFGAKTRVGYGRMSYIKSNTELQEEIASYDNAQLAELFAEKKGDWQLHEAFEVEAKKRPYDEQLDKLYRKFYPYRCLLHELEDKKNPRWKDIVQLRKTYKKRLKGVEIDQTDSVIQAVFNLCLSLLDEGIKMPEWLAMLAPSACDYLAEKTVEQIEKLLDNYQQLHPPFSDFKGAIEASESLDSESREYLVELFFDE